MMADAMNSSGVGTLLTQFRRHLEMTGTHDAWLRIDPETARWIVGYANPRNRPLSERGARYIKMAMTGGEWKRTGDSLKFSVKGELLDGQHRLAAIADSGMTIEMLCVFGLDDSVFDVLDTGRARSGSDALHVAGVPNATTVAHLVAWVHTFEKRPGQSVGGINALRPADILHLYRTEYSDAGEHLVWGQRLKSACGIGKSQGATLHYAFSRFATPAHADKFFLDWMSQKTALATALAARFRDILVRTGRLPSAFMTYGTAILAWNLWVQGKRVSQSKIIYSIEMPGFPLIFKPDGKLTVEQQEITELRRRRDELDQLPGESETACAVGLFIHRNSIDRIAREEKTTAEAVRFMLDRFRKRSARRKMSPAEFAQILTESESEGDDS